MQKPSANERVFQGILLKLISQIIEEDKDSKFDKILQEQNIGVGKTARFADGLLYSKIDAKNKILFELKRTSWDATDEALVEAAMEKAYAQGYEYFVTGTPRQLVIYQTFGKGVPVNERKLKIYTLSNVRKDDDILLPTYEKEIYPKLKIFLQDLSDITHNVRVVQWDSIDKLFVSKLSLYILEASARMNEPMFQKIKNDNKFQNKLKKYLVSQDIFNVGLGFENTDVYNICQLANYLLYLKIIFYSYLQRDVPALKLKELKIPEDKQLLNKTLRARFDDVLKHDFEMIFQKSILDDFEFPDNYIPVLKGNVEQIKHLQFHDLSCDIIGAIYNTLIDNQEQHHRGQHFTNTNEVDIVNAFCINESTQTVMDSGCGAGTFLVRAYQFIKHFHPQFTHEHLLEKLWGIEIAGFPAFLATMNLSLLDIKTIDNYPLIIQSDFSEASEKSHHELTFLNETKSFKAKKLFGKHYDVQLPKFDACVGNPPYIRQELIEKKEKWNALAQKEFRLKKINQQSDLYVYYLMHTASFLKEGGRLGYVVASSWLDVSFGKDLQKFLLDHFKIIAIIDNQKKRSFETASINTSILILEKCSEKIEREKNNIRFVRIYKDYEEFIGKNDDDNRVEKVLSFVSEIEKSKRTKKTDDHYIRLKNQKEIEEESTSDKGYENGYWGAKYIRSPEIFDKIIEKAGDKLIPLNDIADVRRGITSGANEFFYVIDDTEEVFKMSDEEYYRYWGTKREEHKIDWKYYGWYFSEMTRQHHLMERQYLKPLFKTQSEAKNLEVDLDELKYCVLVCNETRNELAKYKKKILRYIEIAEEKQYAMHTRPATAYRASVLNKKEWFHLGKDIFIGDFIFPSKIGERYRLIDNRSAVIFADKVNYNIKIKKEYSEFSDLLYAILNSITFRFFVDLFSRQLTGNQTLSDVDVNVVKKTLIIIPVLLLPKKTEIIKIFEQIKSREQGTIFEEVKQKDRKKLDIIIFECLGFTAKDVDELYAEAGNYVRARNEKSASVTTSKTKQKLSYEQSLQLIKERFPEINLYHDLLNGMETKPFAIPNLQAKFSTETKNGNGNLWNVYNVYFKETNTKQYTVGFSNIFQLKLFQFLYETFETKGIELNLPNSPKDCEVVLKNLKFDFDKYGEQMKGLLKSFRSKANPNSIYRDLVFS